MYKIYLIFILTALNTLLCSAQIIPDTLNDTILKQTWKAQWISHPYSQVSYGVYHFRNQFELKQIPQKFIVHVSADNRYRLYVNNQPVTLGPAWGDLLHWRFESVDIAPYLQEGNNVIAAQVVNFGAERAVSQFSYRTGFLLQVDGNQESPLNTSLTSWKVKKSSAFSPIHIDWRVFPYYYAAFPCDTFNVGQHLWGWKDVDYDDQDWMEPVPIGYNRKGTPRWGGHGFGDQSGWLLTPRNIPLSEETKQRFDHIERTENIRVDEKFLNGTEPITIPANTKASILLDHSVHTRAYPEIHFSKGKGSSLKIEYVEALIDQDRNKGNRDITKNKQTLGYYDIILADGSDDRMYRPLWIRVFRYVELQIETAEEPLVLHDLYSIYTAYPYKLKASFSSDQPLLEKMIDVAWRTLRNATGEVFEDGPYYEQLMYAGDARVASIISLYLSGDERMTKNAIDLFDNSRMPEGLTYSRYPSNQVQINPQYSLSWVQMIYDYFMHGSDPEFTQNYLRGIEGVLHWYEDLVDSTGMLGEVPFLKHIEAKSGTPRHPGRGHSAQQTLYFALTLDYATEIFTYFKEVEKAHHFKRLSEKLKEATFRLCYDPQKKIFADTPDRLVYTQHANVLAILNDMLSSNERKTLMATVLNDTSLVQSLLFFKFYVFQALDKTGLGDLMIAQFEPWKLFLDHGLTTFPESILESRSDCHPWSAHPSYFLLSTVAGIKPAAPGFRKILIEPNFGKLNQLNIRMPHPKGEIILELEKNDQQVIGKIFIPDKSEAIFSWQHISLQLQEGWNKIDL